MSTGKQPSKSSENASGKSFSYMEVASQSLRTPQPVNSFGVFPRYSGINYEDLQTAATSPEHFKSLILSEVRLAESDLIFLKSKVETAEAKVETAQAKVKTVELERNAANTRYLYTIQSLSLRALMEQIELIAEVQYEGSKLTRREKWAKVYECDRVFHGHFTDFGDAKTLSKVAMVMYDKLSREIHDFASPDSLNVPRGALSDAQIKFIKALGRYSNVCVTIT